jgi:hypothetical protein
MDKKIKLNTAVEKTVHKHMGRVREGVLDFTILYLRRNKIEVDRDSLSKILDVVKLAIDAQHMEKLDLLLKELDASLNDFVEE